MSQVSNYERARVKPGRYEFKFQFFQTQLFMGRWPKLVLWFSILDYGDYNGGQLPRYGNLEKLKGKPGRSGKFVLGRYGDFYLEYLNLFDRPSRNEIIDWDLYRQNIIVGEVCDVVQNHKSRKYHRSLVYSKIDDLIKVKTI